MIVFHLSQTPSNIYCAQLSNAMNSNALPEKERAGLKSLVEANLLFQKLKMENDEIGFTKRDPYLANKFEVILAEFPVIRTSTALNSQTSIIRSSEMKIFSSWQKQFNLLFANSNIQQDQYSIYMKNVRILKRIAAKITIQFQKLQDSLLLCAIEVEGRMPNVEQEDSKVPFPDSGETMIWEMVTSLNL